MLALDHLMEVLAIDNHTFNGKNLINHYRCEKCGGAITTVDRHVGTTPYIMMCRAKPECDGEMKSSGYRNRHHVDSFEYQIDFEWYRPISEDECQAVRTIIHKQVERDLADVAFPNPDERDHMRNLLCSDSASYYTTGGLHIRPYTHSLT